MTSQTSVALGARQKTAEKLCDCESEMLGAAGERTFELGQVIVAVAEADLDESALLAAVIVMDAGEGGTAGAV